MRILLLLLMLPLMIGVYGQVDMEEQEYLKNGKIKMTHINYAQKYAKPDYKEFKKISELRNVKKVKGEVVSMEIYCEKSGTLKYSREFVARGNENEDGTLDNVFGYYSERADMWAVPYNGSIYIINSSIRNISSSKDMVIPFVLGDDVAEYIDLYNYYKEIYAKYSGEKFEREERKSKEKLLEKTLKMEEKFDKFSIEKNEISSIKLLHKFGKISSGTQLLTLGTEVVLDNGTVVKSQYFDGVAMECDYLYEVTGTTGSVSYWNYTVADDYKCDSTAGHYKMPISFKSRPDSDDFISVKVKRRSNGELLLEEKINLNYDAPILFNYSGSKGYRNEKGENGADIIVDVELIEHSETWEPLLLYTIQYDYGTTDWDGNPNAGTTYVKMSPEANLTVMNNGGVGGDSNNGGIKGGKPGTLKLNVADNVDKYTFTSSSREGASGWSVYKEVVYKETTNNSNSSNSSSEISSEITIANNTGKSVCIAHYGGSTVVNNGSSESFSCRDLYYGVMDGANCTGTKGSKIADENSDCERTITLK